MGYSRREFAHFLENVPIVAAVKTPEELKALLQSDCPIAFVLFGDVCNISSIVEKIKLAGKQAVVHIDLVEGLAHKDVAVRFIKEHTKADGIISTKSQLIKAAKELDLLAIQRFFILDSLSLDNVYKQLPSVAADAIEILPAINPKIVKKFTAKCPLPTIVGGLISDKEDVIQMLGVGASAVSTTKAELWDI